MADARGREVPLAEWLAADFGLRVVEAVVAEGGVDRDARLWRVSEATGRDFAVKWTSGGSIAGLGVTRALAERGVDGIVAPLATRSGRWWSDRGGRRLVVQPWLDAPVALDVDLEECHWVALGRLLGAVHATPVTALTDLPPSDHQHPRLRGAVAALQRDLDGALHSGRATVGDDDLVALVVAEAALLCEVVDALLSGADHLHVAEAWCGQGTPRVVCHADPHLGNVLAGAAGRVWLLDWDDAVIAPREQDLLFVLDGGVLGSAPVTFAQAEAFFAGYGAVELDRQALAYHRSIRALEDLVDFALEVLAPDRHDRATRVAACRYLRGNLVAGGLTEAALRSLHEVGALPSIPTLRSAGA